MPLDHWQHVVNVTTASCITWYIYACPQYACACIWVCEFVSKHSVRESLKGEMLCVECVHSPIGRAMCASLQLVYRATGGVETQEGGHTHTQTGTHIVSCEGNCRENTWYKSGIPWIEILRSNNWGSVAAFMNSTCVRFNHVNISDIKMKENSCYTWLSLPMNLVCEVSQLIENQIIYLGLCQLCFRYMRQNGFL